MMDCITLLQDSLESIAKMPDADAGALIKALINHANGQEPDIAFETVLVQAVYPLIKGQVDRTAEIRSARSAAGKKGGEANASKDEAKPKQNTSKDEAQVQVQEHIEERSLTGSKEKPAEPAHRFTPPTVEEAEEYCRSKGYQVDAERFVNFYTSKNWYVGKNKMVNWHSALANWAKDRKEQKPPNKPEFNFTQRTTDYDALLNAIGG